MLVTSFPGLSVEIHSCSEESGLQANEVLVVTVKNGKQCCFTVREHIPVASAACWQCTLSGSSDVTGGSGFKQVLVCR